MRNSVMTSAEKKRFLNNIEENWNFKLGKVEFEFKWSKAPLSDRHYKAFYAAAVDLQLRHRYEAIISGLEYQVKDNDRLLLSEDVPLPKKCAVMMSNQMLLDLIGYFSFLKTNTFTI